MTKTAADSVRYYYAMARKGWANLSQNHDGSSEENPNIRILRACALERGLNVEEFVDGTYQCTSGNITRFFGPSPDTHTAFWLCANKYATYEQFRKHGFTHVPYYKRYSLGTINEARRDFTARNKTVVIKPSRMTYGGSGVTANIRSVKELNRAIFKSLGHSSEFLMEDHIEGDNFRVLCYRNKVLNTVQRIPANVTGDGVNSIKRLIDIENQRRTSNRETFRWYPIPIDDEVYSTLKNKGITLDHVPAEGEVVFVRTVCNSEAGDETRDVSGAVHPEVLRDCQDIMRMTDVTLGGIDIITTDISKPLGETGGVINEVNTSPGLDFHDRATCLKVIDCLFEQH